MKYEKIIGGTKRDAEKKFPWLKDADFKNAIIDTTKSWLIWKDGTWEGGVWKGGVWKVGIWEGGVWEDGVWKDGFMWSNLDQEYIKVIYKDGKFTRR